MAPEIVIHAIARLPAVMRHVHVMQPFKISVFWRPGTEKGALERSIARRRLWPSALQWARVARVGDWVQRKEQQTGGRR